MEFLNEWITNIIIFILLAAVVEMLLPQTSLQKYVKLVLGLILIVIILNPIFTLFAVDTETLFKQAQSLSEEYQRLERNLEKQKLEIQAEQAAYILEQTAVQLKGMTEEALAEQFNYQISEIQLSVKEKTDLVAYSPEEILNNLASIKINLVRINPDRSVQAVKEVVIDTSKKREKDGRDEEIRTYLADKWGVDPRIIDIFIEKEAGSNE